MIRVSLSFLVSLAVLDLPLLASSQGSEDKKDEEKGWVQIFDGKDLTGWTVYPQRRGELAG